MHRAEYDGQAVGQLVDDATTADGHPPFSGHKLAVIGGDRSRVGAWSDGSVLCAVGVAALHEADGHWAIEVAVAPQCRSRQVEDAAIRLAVALIPDAPAHTIWAFRADQREAAERLGYREVRSVLRMTGPIPDEIVGTRSRTSICTMESEDIAGIVDLNNRVFADHPEQAAMTARRFASLMEQSGSESRGVLVARRGERIAGFCVTKYEGGRSGEIFLIAVDPKDRHLGIGRELIGAGTGVLRSHGADTVNVWVDAANEAAVRLYGSLGLAKDFVTRELALA